MGYYPIKCIRCAHISTNDKVLFDTMDANKVMERMLEENNDLFMSDNDTKAFTESNKSEAKASSIWDDDDDDDMTISEDSHTLELSRYMTCAEIERFAEQNGLDKCVRHYQHVDVTPDFAEVSNHNEELLVGVTFQKTKGGNMVRANRRFCPYCHCELPPLSGSMPTYNITVMGTSASGKTVYLCALNRLLAESHGTLPYNSSLTCISANKANQDFVGKSNALFEEGILPGTTQIVLTDPLVVQVTYRIKDSIKKCLLSLADMRGEDLVAQDGENLMARGEFFSRADAFMIMASPLNMQYIHNALPHEVTEEYNPAVHQTLIANISQYILPFFSNGTISAPTAIMISKCDVLKNNAQRLIIPLHNPVVAAEPNIKFTGSYFAAQDKGTQTIMQCDKTLYSFLSNTFSRKYFTSFSSLGTNVEISEDENQNQHVTNPFSIHPIRVIDPIIYILISLGFLPDFSKMEAGPQFTKNNVEILNRWIEERT